MDLFDLVAKITLDTSGYKKGLDDVKKGLVTVGKVVGAGITAAATGVGILGKQAIEAYADYEQLVGGVETLFKDSAGAVQKYAANAYKTAGLSANQYMETVTGFSAALIQSLGGDTEEAAKVADRAIVDMADNANKMGTSVESIQTAYQGFAKQNYTMLDNLKLGYGGTKEEMARLIADAAQMTDVQEQLGVTVDESSLSFDNIVNAISVMQASLGIAGATATEASTTISGSVASMQSAWSNLVVGIADDQADFDALVNNFAESVGTAAENILPRIGVALEGVGQLVEGLAPVIVEAIPTIVANVLPTLLDSAMTLLMTVVTTLIDNLPLIFDVGLQAILTLADSLVENLPTMIPAIISVLLTIIDKLTDPDAVLQLVNAAFKIIVAVSEGLIEAMPVLLKKVPEIVANIIRASFEQFPIILSAIGKILANIGRAFTPIIKTITGIFSKAWKGVKRVFKPAFEFFAGIWSGIKNAFGSVTSWFRDTFSRAWEAVKNVFSTGGRIFTGIKEGIASVFKNVVNRIIDGINKVVAIPFNAINGVLNKLRSLSILGAKPFGWISSIYVPQIPKLAKGGIVDTPTLLEAGELYKPEAIVPLDKLWKEMHNMWEEHSKKAPSAPANVTINVYPSAGMDENKLANMVMDKMQRAIDRRVAVF